MTEDESKLLTDQRTLLAKARQQLAQGDLRRASANGWRTATQVVAAVADQRGLPHEGDRDLAHVVNRLMEETGDRDLGRNFYIVHNLHYYGEIMGGSMIDTALGVAQEFLDRMEKLLK